EHVPVVVQALVTEFTGFRGVDTVLVDPVHMRGFAAACEELFRAEAHVLLGLAGELSLDDRADAAGFRVLNLRSGFSEDTFSGVVRRQNRERSRKAFERF